MNKAILSTCVYCEQEALVIPWKETGEMVCRQCRHDFVDQEFDEAEEVDASVDIKEKIREEIPF